mmetsp:Transcript_16116/g.46473  ORF Transcript_16116/g.46473 Transcript_16116/m.46473 type:complete len:177 (-) Transcript_16116:1627-2157(-)
MVQCSNKRHVRQINGSRLKFGPSQARPSAQCRRVGTSKGRMRSSPLDETFAVTPAPWTVNVCRTRCGGFLSSHQFVGLLLHQLLSRRADMHFSENADAMFLSECWSFERKPGYMRSSTSSILDPMTKAHVRIIFKETTLEWMFCRCEQHKFERPHQDIRLRNRHRLTLRPRGMTPK